MPVGPNAFWPEEREEVGTNVLHIHPHVRHRLRAVHQGQGADPVGHGDDFP